MDRTSDFGNAQNDLLFDDIFLYESLDESETNVADKEKWELIDTWLEKVYKGKPVPPFERNASTASALYEIALFNQEQDAIAEIILKQQKLHAFEYRTETRRIKNILHAFGISKDDFSRNGAQSVKILATLATILELGNVERSSFFSAIAQLGIDLSHIEQQNRDISRTINSLEISTQEAKLRYYKLREILTNLRRNWDTKEDQKLKEWKRNTMLLDQKAKEYQLKLSRLERQYTAMNIEDGGLRFQDLKSKEEQIEALEQLVKDKTKKLKAYQVLPPDVILAKLQLDAAQHKLAELTETRDELIKQMAINLQQ